MQRGPQCILGLTLALGPVPLACGDDEDFTGLPCQCWSVELPNLGSGACEARFPTDADSSDEQRPSECFRDAYILGDGLDEPARFGVCANGELTWTVDDEANPRAIVLCPDLCTTLVANDDPTVPSPTIGNDTACPE